jgi:hypothetical protein
MAEVTQQQVVDYIKGISVLELSAAREDARIRARRVGRGAMPMAMPRRGGGAARGARSKRRPSSP